MGFHAFNLTRKEPSPPEDSSGAAANASPPTPRCCPCTAEATLALGALHGCPPNTVPARQLLLERVALAAGPTAAFLKGTAVYALSQQWEDLLSTYLLRLHAVPYCGVQLLDCSAEASASRQFRYVAALLASTAFLQTWAEMGPLPYSWHVWRTARIMKVVPQMIGMCLGWALGNAFKARHLVSLSVRLAAQASFANTQSSDAYRGMRN